MAIIFRAFILVFFTFISYFLFHNSLVGNTSQQEQKEPFKNENIEILNQESFSAWIPNWASKEGFDSLKNNFQKFSSISPVWYEVDKNGEIKSIFPSNFNSIVNFAKEKNIELIPTITLFDHNYFSIIAKNQSSIEKHVKNIIQQVNANNYDGIDIDYESIKLKDKEAFFTIISSLSKEFKKLNKKLTVSVLAKWGDDVVYNSLIETRQVHDYERLSEYVDQIRIMAYDFTSSKSQYPGPIAPISFINQVLDYALSKSSSEKIVLGIHTYAYEWYTYDSNDKLAFDPTGGDLNTDSKNKTRVYSFDLVKQAITKYQGERFFFEGEKVFKYSKTNDAGTTIENRVLVYIDQEGIDSRISLAKQKGINNFIFWRLGNELDLFEKI